MLFSSAFARRGLNDREKLEIRQMGGARQQSLCQYVYLIRSARNRVGYEDGLLFWGGPRSTTKW